jgi:hypothetical protein
LVNFARLRPENYLYRQILFGEKETWRRIKIFSFILLLIKWHLQNLKAHLLLPKEDSALEERRQEFLVEKGILVKTISIGRSYWCGLGTSDFDKIS